VLSHWSDNVSLLGLPPLDGVVGVGDVYSQILGVDARRVGFQTDAKNRTPGADHGAHRLNLRNRVGVRNINLENLEAAIPRSNYHVVLAWGHLLHFYVDYRVFELVRDLYLSLGIYVVLEAVGLTHHTPGGCSSKAGLPCWLSTAKTSDRALLASECSVLRRLLS